MKIPVQYIYRDYSEARRLDERFRLRWWFWCAYLAWLIYRFPPPVEQLLHCDFSSVHSTPFILIVLAVIVLTVVEKQMSHRSLRGNPLLQNTHEVEITSDGIALMGRYSPLKIGWSEFTKFRANKNVTLLYQYDELYQIIPRRWFTDDQYAEFQSLLHAAFDQRPSELKQWLSPSKG